MKKPPHKQANKTEGSKNIRNLEFEGQNAKEKPISDFIETGRDGSDDFKKEFQLNWTFRNDLAKTILALSAGMLALLVSLAASPLFKSIPPWMLLLNMFLLIVTIFLNVASLWTIISVTHVGLDFMKLAHDFATSYEQMIKEHGKFMPNEIYKFFHIPFDNAWKKHNLALKYLHIGLIAFLCSLLLLSLMGVKSISDVSKPCESMNLNKVKSTQSSGTNTR